MDWAQYHSLGLATDWDTKAGGNLPNPNGPSWANDVAADEPYALPRESRARQPGVQEGRTVPHPGFKSTTYPGTTRDWWVHIPADCYLTDEPCSLIVFQDGNSYQDEAGTVRAAILLDNLVHAGALPPTVAVFIDPGAHPDVPGQRSVEYDVVSDRYATFLSDEILPLVELDCDNISADPDRRAICGASSGGICAFSVAWYRPDLFANVISHVGSFANIRGGHHYPWLIRNTKRKPIRRVYLQDGTADGACSPPPPPLDCRIPRCYNGFCWSQLRHVPACLSAADNGNGHWVLANQQMAVALRYVHSSSSGTVAMSLNLHYCHV